MPAATPRPFLISKKFQRKNYVQFNDPLIAAIHQLAEKTIDKKYHGRLDASALVCTAIMAHSLLDTLLTQQSKTPQLARSCTTRHCMSCQQEFSVTTRMLQGKPVSKIIRRYHRFYIHPLQEHRYVLICYPCVKKIKTSRTYCSNCIHIPDRKTLKSVSKKTENDLVIYFCHRCEFPYTQVEKSDPIIFSAKPHEVQKDELLDPRELGIR